MAGTPLQCHIEIRDSACGLADHIDGSNFKKGTAGCASAIRGSHYSASREKLMSGCWRGGSGRLFPGSGTVDKLFTLAKILEGSWEFAHPVYMCFVDLEKA